MAEINYIVNENNPNSIPGFENFSSTDLNLITQFEINNLFDSTKHYIELYVADLSGNIIEEPADIVGERAANTEGGIPDLGNYKNYRLLSNAQSAGRSGAAVLTIDPIQDAQDLGYTNGGITLLYNFLNDLYTTNSSKSQFFISAISPDRTELQLKNLTLSNQDIVDYTSVVRNRISTQAYFDGFRLNFGSNQLLIGINIDTLVVGGEQTVIVKLYEPLPSEYNTGIVLTIVEVVSDSVAYTVDATFTFPETPVNRLRPANFNLEVTDNQVIPTQYLGYDDLFSYPVNNTNNQLYSLVSEKGIELSIDHTDYANFIHFSSAYERLANFKYKLQLVENYTNNLTLTQTATSQSVGTTGSINYYQNLITGVVSNFDHYERYLYYQSSSYAWPKSNSVQPYVNYSVTSSQGLSWYANQLAMANYYDANNGSILINTIPVYLREDSDNENYLTFVHMIGQHFDNLWIYAKAVTDKYDADNRLNNGIPKDLVGEALRNFGVKLYTSNKSIENLFDSFIGQGYQSGSEVINTYITGSVTGSNLPVEDISFNDYTKEVQKRIYHNLSHIVKTKGTERGVRALINCFGIPSDILKIKIYGGRSTQERPFYGDYTYYTSSLSKIRLDYTGSITTGSTLSQYTSIYKRDKKYTDDLHKVEIGFSPVDNVDNLIVSYSLATGSLSTFSIDDYIGDPRSLTSPEYGLLNASGSISTSLDQLVNQIMSGSSAYNVQDYVRLIKFFDNVVFKMVRDYVPGRSTVDTGIIIKPHLLQRSKARSPRLTVSQSQIYLTASIDTGFISGSNAGTFGGRDQYTTITLQNPNNANTNYRFVQTPFGLGKDYRHGHEETKYDGDFSGSNIIVTNGNLTSANTYTQQLFSSLTYDINLVSSSNTVCLLGASQGPIRLEPGTEYYSSTFFSGTQTSVIYTASIQGGSEIYFNFPYTFTDSNFDQYDVVNLLATASNVPNCQVSVQTMYASCSLTTTTLLPNPLIPDYPYNLTTWFTPAGNPNMEYYVDNNLILSPTSYIFVGDPSTSFVIEMRDTTIEDFGLECKRSITLRLNAGCPITLPYDGQEYYYDNADPFAVSEGVIEGTTEHRVQRGGGNNIKSLFATGTGDPNTKYDVKIHDINGNDIYINKGTSPVTTPDTENPWSGDEQLDLVFYPDQNFWGWRITGGIFAPEDLWANITPTSTPPANINLREQYYVAIRAYTINPEFSGCSETVSLLPPVPVTPPSNFCVRNVDYQCVLDPLTGMLEPVFNPGVDQTSCILSPNPCN